MSPFAIRIRSRDRTFKVMSLGQDEFPRVRWTRSGNVVNLVGPVIPNLAGGGGCLDVDRFFFWTLTSQTEQICGMRCWPMILPTCKPRKLERSPCGKQKWHWQQSLNQKEYVLFKWMQWKCDLRHIFGCFSMIYPIASMYGMLPSFTIQINHSCIGKYTSPMDGMGTILWFQHIKNASNKNSLKLPLESFKFKPWLLKVMIHLW